MLKTLNSKPDPNGTYLSPSFPRTTAWKQDDSMEGGGRECLEHILEIERIRRQSRGGNPVRQDPLYSLDPRRSLCPEGYGDDGNAVTVPDSAYTGSPPRLCLEN